MLTSQEVSHSVEEIALSKLRGIQPDRNIVRLVKHYQMIDPFVDHQVRMEGNEKIISYGLSSFGYDLRVSDEFQIFSATTGQQTCVDPKQLDERMLYSYKGKVCIIPPNSFALARSMEWFNMPSHILGLCLGKSTYARAGIVTNFTPFEPGWRGYVTIEISNTTPLPCKIYAGEGIGQVLFNAGEQPNVTYADRGGKYQDQHGITLPKV